MRQSDDAAKAAVVPRAIVDGDVYAGARVDGARPLCTIHAAVPGRLGYAPEYAGRQHDVIAPVAP